MSLVYVITKKKKRGVCTHFLVILTLHKKCPWSELFWSVFSAFRLNTNQNNLKYGQFPRRVNVLRFYLVSFWYFIMLLDEQKCFQFADHSKILLLFFEYLLEFTISQQSEKFKLFWSYYIIQISSLTFLFRYSILRKVVVACYYQSELTARRFFTVGFSLLWIVVSHFGSKYVILICLLIYYSIILFLWLLNINPLATHGPHHIETS